MPDLYDRQQELNLQLPSSVTIAGLGGVGSWVAIQLAMSGVQNLYLFDPDTIEESNRNRLPFCQSSVNRPKVEVVAEYIRAIRPNAIVVAIQDKLSGMLLDIQLSVSQLVMECTDSPKAQFEIYSACKKADRKFIRAGYDYDMVKKDFHITVASSVSGWIKTDVEEEDYAITPSYVCPALEAATRAVDKALRLHNQEISLYLSEIGIPVVKRQRRLTARCAQPQTTGRRR